MNIMKLVKEISRGLNALTSHAIFELKDSINYYLYNKEQPNLRFWTILCFSTYILLVGIMFLPLLSLTEIYIVFSLISLYTLILASIFGYLGLANAIIFQSFFIIITALYWEKANEFYSFAWDQEVYARQFTDELSLIIISFISFILTGAFITSILSEKARKRSQQLEWLSTTDGLTEIYNHRFFQQRLVEEIARSQRENYSLGLLMIDIDKFKKFNDEFGHSAGDELLKKSACFFKQKVRVNDIVCRYGGDEFAIILPNISLDKAGVLADRLKNSVNDLDINLPGSSGITISIGCSVFPTLSKNEKELILHADKALYRAKQMGGNQVQLYGEPFESCSRC